VIFDSAASQLRLSVWSKGQWSDSHLMGTQEIGQTATEVKPNNFGAAALVLRKQESAGVGPYVEIRFVAADGSVQSFGSDQNWSKVVDLSLTNSGFVYGRAYDSTLAVWKTFRWRNGGLLVLDNATGDNLIPDGISENGEFIDGGLSSVYRQGAWQALADKPLAINELGELWTEDAANPPPANIWDSYRDHPQSHYFNLIGDTLQGSSPWFEIDLLDDAS
jgi:hypothetical protein